MVKQIIAGPIQAILAILGSRLLLNTQNVVIKTFRPQSRSELSHLHPYSYDTPSRPKSPIRETKDDRIELTDFSETTESGYKFRHSAGGRIGDEPITSGFQLDTIADTFASQVGEEIIGNGLVWNYPSTSTSQYIR